MRVAALEAESALVDAQAELETARLDAALPPELVSGLDYDRYQSELDRTTHEAGLKRTQLEAAREAVARQRRASGLAVEKLQHQRDYYAPVPPNPQGRATPAGHIRSASCRERV